MKYTMFVNGSTALREIEGETLVSAIENNFAMIADVLHLGNNAGYQLDAVRLEPVGDKMQLRITAHGSDAKIDYDPTDDEPQEHRVEFSGVPAEELVPHEFEMTSSKKEFDPFADLSYGMDDGWRAGVAFGLLDEVSIHRCRIHDDCPLSITMSCKYPTLMQVSLEKYRAQYNRMLSNLHPNTDAGTQRLIDRANEILDAIGPKADCSMAFVGKAHVSTYFNRLGKETALQHYRTKSGMSQTALASAVGISTRQLQNYESIDSRLGDAKYAVVERLAEAIGCKPSDLVQDGIAVLVSK